MAIEDDDDIPVDPIERLDGIIDIYGRVMSGVMMLLGLRQWAIILGLMSGVGGVFEQMSLPWQLATAHFAIVDLVASVGLWQRTAWGNVVWIYAALAEVALHSALIGTFGPDYPIVALHAATILAFVALLVVRYRLYKQRHG